MTRVEWIDSRINIDKDLANVDDGKRKERDKSKKTTGNKTNEPNW
jgi:hypothetical protein